MTGSTGTAPYRVVYSERCRDGLQDLLDRTRTGKRYDEFAEAIRKIDLHLQWIPWDFGDPLRDYPGLGIQERIGTIPPLVVLFGVDEERKIVYVSRPFAPLPQADS